MSLIIGDCRGSDCLSRTIGWFGGGYYSHSTTLFPRSWLPFVSTARPDYSLKHIPPGGALVLDSRNDSVGGAPPGVQIRAASYLPKHGEAVDWRHLPCSARQEACIYRALISQLGKPYDKIGILDYVTGALRDRNWQNESAWFCSELRTWSWIAAGLLSRSTYPNALPYRVTPGGSALIAWGLSATPVPLQV
jgi:hypothetical protein